MSLMHVERKSRVFLLFLLLLQFMVCLTVFVDIPVVRQVVGFIYLTFVPGLIIIKLLKLNELDGLETVLFSVGFSVAFLMIAGLLVNEFGFLAGISEPLSLIPLMIFLNGFTLVGAILSHLRSDGVKLWEAKTLKLHPSALILISLPVLSIIGALYVNTYENNMILLFLIIAIAGIFAIGAVSKKFLPKKLYPLAVLMVAIALLFHSSLISNYIYGSDIHHEYFVFKTTQNNAYWDSNEAYLGGAAFGRIHSMLSVTILPTIHSTLLNIDSTWIFKLIFPLILSFVALGLYQLWKGYLGKKYAFISAFFFMAYNIFYNEMLGLNRQIVAELFFVLLLLVILNKKLKPPSKILCFTILSFGLVTSHYGLSELFLVFISLIVISSFIAKRPSRNVTISMVVIFFIVMFTWYIHMSGSAVFDSFVEFGSYLYNRLGSFFDLSSRETTVLRGLGLETPPTIWNAISRAFAYATQFFIVVGFVGLITKRVRVHFERDYFTFTFIAMAFLAALILVPGLANTMNMTRFYHIVLFFLAPLCILGAEFLVGFVFKRKKEVWASILLLIVLIPYFLFQTGFVYEVAESESWSIPLSKYRMDKVHLSYMGLVDEQSVFGAQWMSKNMDTMHTQVYADSISRYKVLTSYGLIYENHISVLSNTTKVAMNGVVYLSPLNTIYGIIAGSSYAWNSTEFSPLFGDMNKVYSNGGCEIYVSVPQNN